MAYDLLCISYACGVWFALYVAFECWLGRKGTATMLDVLLVRREGEGASARFLKEPPAPLFHGSGAGF